MYMTKPKQVQKKTLRKYWENFFRNYAPFYIMGGHNYGNYCTLKCSIFIDEEMLAKGAPRSGNCLFYKAKTFGVSLQPDISIPELHF